MSQEISLEGAAALQIGQSLRFRYHRNGRAEEGFLLRHKTGWSSFRNQCRHVLVPLDMDDGEFYWEQAERIQCKFHGATFLPDSGLCDSGPCTGAMLEKFEILWKDGVAVVQIP